MVMTIQPDGTALRHSPVVPRRSLCPAPFRSHSVTSFFRRWQQHPDPREVAAQFPVSLRTVQRLFARFARRGAAAVAPDYHRCGQRQPGQTPLPLVQDICQTRRNHPRWGADMIRLELEDRYAAPPCARTLRRHLRQAGLQPAPAGRTSAAEYPHVPRATRPHQGWQTDACEELHLQGNRRAGWLRIVDECTGAFLQTTVFEVARWERVDRHRIQEAFRAAFAGWGLPERFRVDNGYPWGSSGDFPPELALWLIGLGIAMVWLKPACPQQNGVVEHAQGTGQNWAEPQTCATAAVLQARCDALDRRQRERYPYRQGRSRLDVYPQLRHSGRRYQGRREGARWDVKRVWAAVARHVVKRRVACTGSVSIYHRSRYVGKPYIGKDVYVTLDPSGPAWVIADAAGTQLRTHAADELSAERIRGLSVMCRKGKRP